MAGTGRGPREVDRGSALPLWAQLSGDLRERLASGEFAAAFPTEHELMGAYGVSRATVREALRRLRGEGLVVAERGRGSRAAQPRIEQRLGTLYSLFASVEAADLEQRSVVRDLVVTADAGVAAQLGLPPAAELVRLERLRLAGGEPLALDVAWLAAAAARPLLDADFTRTALYRELEVRCGVRVTGGRERISAVVPAAEQRRLLGIDEGTAALAVERVGYASGRPVEYRHTLVRGDRFTLAAEWSPQTAYALAPAPAADPVHR